MAGAPRKYRYVQGLTNFYNLRIWPAKSSWSGNSRKLQTTLDASPLATTRSTNWRKNRTASSLETLVSLSCYLAQIFWVEESKWFTLLNLLWRRLAEHWVFSLASPSSWFGMLLTDLFIPFGRKHKKEGKSKSPLLLKFIVCLLTLLIPLALNKIVFHFNLSVLFVSLIRSGSISELPKTFTVFTVLKYFWPFLTKTILILTHKTVKHIFIIICILTAAKNYTSNF